MGGRAKCHELNNLCRHVAALQLAANVDWRRRRIVSASNPSDADSRLADAGVLSAGEALVGPALDKRLECVKSGFRRPPPGGPEGRYLLEINDDGCC